MKQQPSRDSDKLDIVEDRQRSVDWLLRNLGHSTYQSNVDEFEGIQLSSATFEDLRKMMQSRRDFGAYKSSALSGSIMRMAPGANAQRFVLMLSDDFEQFDLEQEVVYDSSFSRKSGGDEGQSKASIFNEIKHVNYFSINFKPCHRHAPAKSHKIR